METEEMFAKLSEQNESLKRELSESLKKEMLAALDVKLSAQNESLRDEIKGMVDGLGERLGRMERRVNAFEFAPSRPESPRMFRGGVGIHSVAGATAGVRRYSR